MKLWGGGGGGGGGGGDVHAFFLRTFLNGVHNVHNIQMEPISKKYIQIQANQHFYFPSVMLFGCFFE